MDACTVLRVLACAISVVCWVALWAALVMQGQTVRCEDGDDASAVECAAPPPRTP